jgi:hypothetical protein
VASLDKIDWNILWIRGPSAMFICYSFLNFLVMIVVSFTTYAHTSMMLQNLTSFESTYSTVSFFSADLNAQSYVADFIGGGLKKNVCLQRLWYISHPEKSPFSKGSAWLNLLDFFTMHSKLSGGYGDTNLSVPEELSSLLSPRESCNQVDGVATNPYDEMRRQRAEMRRMTKEEPHQHAVRDIWFRVWCNSFTYVVVVLQGDCCSSNY